MVASTWCATEGWRSRIHGSDEGSANSQPLTAKCSIAIAYKGRRYRSVLMTGAPLIAWGKGLVCTGRIPFCVVEGNADVKFLCTPSELEAQEYSRQAIYITLNLYFFGAQQVVVDDQLKSVTY
jgi:hypothetical protein